MAAENEEEQLEPGFVWKYYAYCPHGDQCSKGGSTLGGFFSEDRARTAISNHLRGSTYHLFEQEQADLEASIADLPKVKTKEWKEDADTEDEDPPDRGSSSSKASKRPMPPEPADPPRRRRRTGTASCTTIAKASPKTAGPAGSPMAVSANLERQITKQTQQAAVFVKAWAMKRKQTKKQQRCERKSYTKTRHATPQTKNKQQQRNTQHHKRKTNNNQRTNTKPLHEGCAEGRVCLARGGARQPLSLPDLRGHRNFNIRPFLSWATLQTTQTN